MIKSQSILAQLRAFAKPKLPTIQAGLPQAVTSLSKVCLVTSKN